MVKQPYIGVNILIFKNFFIHWLLKASWNGHDQVVSLLINHRSFICINEKESNGQTALHLGKYLNVFILTIWFVLLFKASIRGHDKVVSLLINHPKCSIKEKDINSETALHYGEYLNK